MDRPQEMNTENRRSPGAEALSSALAPFSSSARSRSLPAQMRLTLEMIKFSHTLFALPFALLAAVIAAGGVPRLLTLAKILAAMVGARSAAIAHNRLAGGEIDAANPRTASRARPSGVLSVRFV